MPAAFSIRTETIHSSKNIYEKLIFFILFPSKWCRYKMFIRKWKKEEKRNEAQRQRKIFIAFGNGNSIKMLRFEKNTNIIYYKKKLCIQWRGYAGLEDVLTKRTNKVSNGTIPMLRYFSEWKTLEGISKAKRLPMHTSSFFSFFYWAHGAACLPRDAKEKTAIKECFIFIYDACFA